MKKAKRGREEPRAEPWEVERLHREMPVKSEEEIKRAIEDCKAELKGAQDKGKVTDCVRRKV